MGRTPYWLQSFLAMLAAWPTATIAQEECRNTFDLMEDPVAIASTWPELA